MNNHCIVVLPLNTVIQPLKIYLFKSSKFNFRFSENFDKEICKFDASHVESKGLQIPVCTGNFVTLTKKY